VSGGQDARSERPATGLGNPEPRLTPSTTDYSRQLNPNYTPLGSNQQPSGMLYAKLAILASLRLPALRPEVAEASSPAVEPNYTPLGSNQQPSVP
jgi:hypothetical protein